LRIWKLCWRRKTGTARRSGTPAAGEKAAKAAAPKPKAKAKAKAPAKKKAVGKKATAKK
jgi:hypothetical protein